MIVMVLVVVAAMPYMRVVIIPMMVVSMCVIHIDIAPREADSEDAQQDARNEPSHCWIHTVPFIWPNAG
jgi:hypothetical protein